VAHCSPLPPDEVAVVTGIPVTSPARTLFDLASLGDERKFAKAFNEMEVRGLTDRLSLPALLDRYPRRPGAATIRRFFEDEQRMHGRTRTELEDRFAALLNAGGLPRPRLNAHVAVADRLFEVDCLWEEEKVIVELDGGAVHRTRLAFERDRERDRLLLAEGWRVMRITWRQLQDDGSTVVADLGRVLQGRPLTL
jgi:very-short-patch-repair endonuclease